MDGDGPAQIAAALEVVHQSSSTNEQRREAQNFLESLKHQKDAPLWGWQLATSEAKSSNVVRHFGLTLIQHAIQYEFINYDESRRLALQNWVVDLATTVEASDPYYIKEKISFLWVAIAKRVWGLGLDEDEQDAERGDNGGGAGGASAGGWIDMDKTLLEMWNASDALRELTLSIHRTLFEDLYIIDDPVASKRATVLIAQCIEVVMSAEDLEVSYDSRLKPLQRLRADGDGWLARWTRALADGLQGRGGSRTLVVKILETLKTCLPWTLPLAVRSSNLLELLSLALTLDDTQVRIHTADCLHILFTRTYNNPEDFDAIVGAVFQPQGIATLRSVYESIRIDVNDVNDEDYLLLKRLVEMIVVLGEYLHMPKVLLPDSADIQGYLSLVLQTTMHPSLLVSGTSLQFWCAVLRADRVAERLEIDRLLPQLLEVAAERCVKYEDVDEGNLSVQFLHVDFDSIPESLVFLGNYRKFVEDLVRLVVCRSPEDALGWLKTRSNAFFASETGWPALNAPQLESYVGNPTFYLAYSQFILTEAALRGVTRWKVWYKGEDKQERAARIVDVVQDWSRVLVSMTIRDPTLLRKQVQTLVQFAPQLKDHHHEILFHVLEKVLTAATSECPPDAADEVRETYRDLRTCCGTELNRLAYMIPEALMMIYSDLERVVGDILASGKLSAHESVAFKSFLLVVSQRSPIPGKVEKFAGIVDPVIHSWTDDGTMKGLMDLEWFMERVGIVKIAEYFRARGVTADTDLLSTPMDDAGRALKSELKNSWYTLFPIRATRIFVQYTIEKLEHDSDEYKALLSLWKPRIQPIVPHILQLVAQIEAYHNPDNWKALPAEVQSFVRYSCTERFWQVGVSTQTRDEFVEESVRAMHTLRDFADSVGHIIRYTREYAFLTIGSIAQLEETLYEIPGIAQNLWTALAGESAGITLHSWRHMITMVLRNVVKFCPVRLLDPFLSEFLPPVLTKLDEVLVSRWDKQRRLGLQLGDDYDIEESGGSGDLSEEMMEEHLLRQLTAAVDRFLIDLSGGYGFQQPQQAESPDSHKAVMRKVVFENKAILGPYLRLCKHIMLFRDYRCSFNCCVLVKNVLPLFILRDSEVDNFLMTDMMGACLELLADPYFADVYNEAGYIITTIYTTLRTASREPFKALADLLPGVDYQSLSDFEVRLASAKSLRQQRGVFLEFLSLVRVMDSGDQSDEAVREAQRRRAAKQANDKNSLLRRKAKPGTDVIEEDPNSVATSMSVLFGE